MLKCFLLNLDREDFIMKNIAILGFGVVGGGVARLITDNKKEIINAGGEDINIKYILDLRDFPDSPFADRIVHDYSVIVNDKSVDTVIEVMGGSHPAYEFTVAALKAGKNVITSNKEVVANFGDEFLRLAEESGVVYRFEASVGGGIPIISPMIGCIAHNKIIEVSGILNGTTNYILTEMFDRGKSFDSALADAQAKGYAEKNPAADILGKDAARKITILAGLATEGLVDVEKVYTEGITGIRPADVICAEGLGMRIKLVGRCIINDEGAYIMVAPFMVSSSSPLYSVSDVYNAVTVNSEPLGNIMFYGQGAGAGATASAVVSDLMQIMRSGRAARMPRLTKCDKGMLPFDTFVSRNYIALDGADAACVQRAFGDVRFVGADECAFITDELSEKEVKARLELCGGKLLSRIRLL